MPVVHESLTNEVDVTAQGIELIGKRRRHLS